jgi:hypothetical protein
MRKINSAGDIESRRKRNTLILSIFMLAILVGGTAGYAFITSSRGNDQANIDAGGARQIGNRWVVSVEGIDISFANSPESVQDIPVNTLATVENYRGSSIYIVSDSSAVNAEIATTLGTYASRVQKACYGPCEEDLPEKDCSENLIIWKDGQDNHVYQEDGCVFIEGDLRAVDAFLFKTLGIQLQ